MRFWDSSAIVALVVHEAATDKVRSVLAEDPVVVAWVLTAVEITSALRRQNRSGDLDGTATRSALHSLDELERAWTVVLDVPQVERRARRLLGSHPLRAADALQLAAALVACAERPEVLPIVTLDERLADSARKEGFRVLPGGI